MRPLILFFAVLFLSGCRPKKVYVEKIKTDTIIKKEIIKVQPSHLAKLEVDSACDSLGNLRPFRSVIGYGGNRVILRTIENKIYIEHNADSIKQIAVEEYKSRVGKEKEIVYKRYIPASFYYSVFFNILTFIHSVLDRA